VPAAVALGAAMLCLRCCCGEPEEKTHDDSRRGFTDWPCFCLFSLCIVAQGALMAYAFQNGDTARYLGLPDSEGHFCGVSPAAPDKAYLYFCKDIDGHFNATMAYCVQDCGDSVAVCPNGYKYEAMVFAGQLCLPRDKKHLGEMSKLLWDSPAVEALLELGELQRSWQPVAISAVCAMMAAFVYLFCLEKYALTLLWSSVAVCVLAPAALGSFYLLSAQSDGVDGLPGTGDSQLDLATGAGLFVVAFAFACIACCKASSVNSAVECIRATCECMRDMPTLLFMPIVVLIIKAAMMLGLILGGLYLGSCVSEVLGQANVVKVDYSPDMIIFIAFYLIMSVWILEFITALSQFAVSYATQLWWFSHYRATSGEPDHSPSFAACTGLRIGFCYHLGTLAFGSCIISLTRGPRMLLQMLLPAASSTNPVSQICLRCCVCCSTCFERFLRFLTKNAYMDVAINGSDFCKAAHHACLVLQNEATACAVLNGATWLFRLTGLGAVSLGGAFLTHLQCRSLDVYARSDSEYYVEDPVFLVGVSFVLCFLSATPFMLVMDQVSDTILYCFAIEHERTNKKNAAGSFTPLVQHGSKDDCHPPETQALLQRAGQGAAQGQLAGRRL